MRSPIRFRSVKENPSGRTHEAHRCRSRKSFSKRALSLSRLLSLSPRVLTLSTKPFVASAHLVSRPLLSSALSQRTRQTSTQIKTPGAWAHAAYPAPAARSDPISTHTLSLSTRRIFAPPRNRNALARCYTHLVPLLCRGLWMAAWTVRVRAVACCSPMLSLSPHHVPPSLHSAHLRLLLDFAAARPPRYSLLSLVAVVAHTGWNIVESSPRAFARVPHSRMPARLFMKARPTWPPKRLPPCQVLPFQRSAAARREAIACAHAHMRLDGHATARASFECLLTHAAFLHSLPPSPRTRLALLTWGRLLGHLGVH